MAQRNSYLDTSPFFPPILYSFCHSALSCHPLFLSLCFTLFALFCFGVFVFFLFVLRFYFHFSLPFYFLFLPFLVFCFVLLCVFISFLLFIGFFVHSFFSFLCVYICRISFFSLQTEKHKRNIQAQKSNTFLKTLVHTILTIKANDFLPNVFKPYKKPQLPRRKLQGLQCQPIDQQVA